MSESRFSRFETEQSPPLASPGFLAIPVATTDSSPAVSPLQWLYQQLYTQAVQATQRPTTRDLFAVMN